MKIVRDGLAERAKEAPEEEEEWISLESYLETHGLHPVLLHLRQVYTEFQDSFLMPHLRTQIEAVLDSSKQMPFLPEQQSIEPRKSKPSGATNSQSHIVKSTNEMIHLNHQRKQLANPQIQPMPSYIPPPLYPG